MDLDIRKMVGKAHCYADNCFGENLSKWYAVRKAFADGYKEAFNDIRERERADSSNENNGLHKHVVSGLLPSESELLSFCSFLTRKECWPSDIQKSWHDLITDYFKGNNR